MIIQKAKKFKAVTGKDSFDFEVKLNAALDTLNKQGVKYELTFNMQMGFCAYLVWEEQIKITESVKEDYELHGVKYKCIQCPYFERPTDGRVKHIKCERGNTWTMADRDCCEMFYEELDKKMLKPKEVDLNWRG